MAVAGETLTVAAGGELRAIDCRTNRVVSRLSLESAPRWDVERVGSGLVLWTVPVVAATEPPPRQGVLRLIPRDGRRVPDDRGRLVFPHFGPRGAVRVRGAEVVVAAAGEVRGYRGAKRDTK